MNTQRNMLSAETPKSVDTTSFVLSSSSRNAATTDSKLFYRRSDDPNSTRTAALQNPVAVEPNEPDKVARALRSLVDGFYARHARTLSGDVGSDPNFSEIQDSGFGASIRTNPANDHGKGNTRNAGNATDVRAHQTFLYCMRILGSRMTPSIVSDELHVADLIKKKLVRDHKSTSKALQFSNLFSRLQSQNILTRKWAILYLLFQISEQTDTGSAETSTSLNGSSMHQSFSYMGLQNLSFTNSQTNARKQGISPPSTTMVQQEYTPCDSSFGKPPKIMMQSQQHRQPRQATEGLTPHARLLASESHGEDVSESALLKDVIFVFQGINGKYVRFDEISESYIIDPKVRISKSNRELIHRLTEIGWLFRRVQAFVKTASTDQTIGLVGQAFCSCLQKELTEYYRLIAVLEAQINRHAESVNNNDTTQTVPISASLATPHPTSPASGLTLKRLMIWTQESLQKLRLMSVLVDCCAEQTGGALVSLIHTYTKHGDPFIQNFIENTLKEVSQPFYHMLQTWIYEGQLDDPYNEFFVACSSNADEENLWRQKYSMNEEMIPAFISKSLANKIFLIGKSLNFLRYSCQDSDWVALRNRNSFDKNLKYGEIAKLESSIDAAYQSTSRRLLDTLFKRFLLLDQLRALKKYMLLGQGDFVQHLMDLLGPSLDQPATTLFRHNLTGMLETAIRGGNLQYENPEILRRLDVRVLEVSAGDTGWDVFSLDYHVDAPISTIFTPQAMYQYLKMFNVLWRLKRAEHVLAAGWRRQMTSAHSLRGMQEIAPDLHTCSVLYGEMVHFVYQMQYYMLFEVLECSWDELMRYIDKQSGDLDGLIKAHERYLNQIVTKGLLASSSSQNLLGRLMRLFDIISRFRDAQDSLYDHACGEVERLARLGRKAYQRTLQGQWGLTDEDDMSEGTPLSDEKSDDVLREIRTRVGDVSRQFKNELSNLLIGLSTHPDTDLKSLSFRLDYNEYYQKQRQKKTNPGSTSNKR